MEVLGIRKIEWLATNLNLTVEQLLLAAQYKATFVQETTRLEGEKVRHTVSVGGLLRTVHERLFHRILIHKFLASPSSHGAVPERSIRSHALVHQKSRYLYTADIANFYPSISNFYIYELFVRTGCAPDVARILTELCTWKGSLPLGFVTSPVIANQVLLPFDQRIAEACAKRNLRYSRFVDDIAISADFRIRTENVRRLLDRLLRNFNLKAKRSKEECGRIEDLLVTKLRIRNGRVGANALYLDEVIRQLQDHVSLGQGGDFEGPLKSRSQLLGKLYFVKWINPNQAKTLWPIFRKIDWAAIRKATGPKVEFKTHPNGLALMSDSECPFEHNSWSSANVV